MTTEAKTKWAIEADYYQTCNCDYGCPCEFEAPPTMGFCEGIGAYKINKGNHGDVNLDGLGFAFALHSPAALHEGGSVSSCWLNPMRSLFALGLVHYPAVRS